MNSLQLSFNPVDYTFKWTEDGWYTWDYKEAHKRARQARDLRAKELVAKGYTVRKSSNASQLITRGGIGSSHPELDFVVTVYMIDAHKVSQDNER